MKNEQQNKLLNNLQNNFIFTTIFLILLGAVICAVYVSLCFNLNIWTDEGFTIALIRDCDTFGEIAAYTAKDVHPPLYYWIVKVITWVFGQSFLVQKLASVVAMFALYIISATYVNKRFGFRVALLFTLTTAAIPCCMEYAIQIRMYSWAMVFVTGAALAALDAYETERIRSYILLGLCGVASAYTQYFAFVAAIWVYGLLMFFIIFGKKGKKKLTKWLIMAASSIVLYLPWLGIMLGQVGGVSENYWIQPITGEVVSEYFKWPFESEYPAVQVMMQVVFVIALVHLIYFFVTNNKTRKIATEHTKEDPHNVISALCFIGIPILVILTGVTLSFIIRPIFVIRYIILAIPLLCLGFAILMSRINSTSFVFLCLFLLGVFYTDYKTNYFVEYQSTCTDATLEALDANVKEDDVIAYNYRGYGYLYEDYFGVDGCTFIENLDLGSVSGDIYLLNTVFCPIISDEDMAAYGLTVEYMGDFGFEHNPFYIYRYHHIN